MISRFCSDGEGGCSGAVITMGAYKAFFIRDTAVSAVHGALKVKRSSATPVIRGPAPPARARTPVSQQRVNRQREVTAKITSRIAFFPPSSLSLAQFFRRQKAAGFVVDGDLVLEDFLDDHFQVGQVAALDQRAGAFHQLEHALLDQGGQLETAADLVHDFVTLEGFDHAKVLLLSCWK